MKNLLAPAFLALAAFAHAQEAAPQKINARLMQQPAVSKDNIAFVYAGDIWVAPKAGGAAVRLSSPRGSEAFPRFSPDGQWIAFTGNYEGNSDLYVVPVTGGEPRRVTYHGASERMLNWFPDGKSLLFQSERASFTGRVGQFWKIPATGGFAEKLPIPYGEFAAPSPDGRKIAYTPISVDFATWKRYRGGMAADIWVYDLDAGTAENITRNDANDSQPMWHGSTVYFLSDRDGQLRDNLWAYDTATKTLRQVTKFTDFDVHFPSMGPAEIVFELGGRLQLLDLASEKVREVEISVVTDQTTVRPRVVNVAGSIRNGTVSQTGKRAVFEARGELFSVPLEHGIVRNVTESSGVAERYPGFSPDGKWLAYWSDRSGEYELTLRPADGKGDEQQITTLGAGYRYYPHWSPDSKRVAFIDSAMKLHLTDVEAKKTEVIDQQLWLYHGELESFRVQWSADSRWLTYAGDTDVDQSAVVLYDTREKKRHQVTSGFFHDTWPTFDPDGKYLYYVTRRWFDAQYSDFDRTWVYVNGQSLVAVPLKKDGPNPLAPRNDEEAAPKKDEKKDEKKEEPKKEEPKPADPVTGTWKGGVTGLPDGEMKFTLTLTLGADGKITGTATPANAAATPVSGSYDAASKTLTLIVKPADSPEMTFTGKLEGNTLTLTADLAGQKLEAKATREGEAKAAEKKDEPKKDAKAVEIDLDGFETRAVVLPPGARRYADVIGLPGKVMFRAIPSAGHGGNTAVWLYDIEKREEKMLIDTAGGYELSGDGKKLLISRSGQWGIVNPSEGQSLSKPLRTGEIEMTVDPRAEWRQIFADAWRIERDFFYDPGLHGVDWKGMRVRYAKLLEDAVTRSDVNFVLGELLGELNVSHAYRGGGDMEGAPSRGVGYLGCDFALDQGAYRIARILDTAPWEHTVRSPLRAQGVNVKEGDFLLAVNGHRLDVAKEPHAALQGLADKTVMLTVNDKPTMDGSREVLVNTIGSEGSLRQYAWVNANRLRVEQASGGQIGYVYVPSTAIDGQNELYRQYRAQFAKPGLIIDERWNSGGQIPERFIELLARKPTNYWGVRDGRDWTTPFMAHPGAKAMLMNGWSGSGGDCFPWLFREHKLGPLIGTRTWGGLIGMTGCPPLIDGGNVTVPTFSIYDREGKWVIEGYGVDPDVPVIDDPAQLAKGIDPQLERAIEEVQKQLKASPPVQPKRPAYLKR